MERYVLLGLLIKDKLYTIEIFEKTLKTPKNTQKYIVDDTKREVNQKSLYMLYKLTISVKSKPR